jgi:hypothetical protein
MNRFRTTALSRALVRAGRSNSFIPPVSVQVRFLATSDDKKDDGETPSSLDWCTPHTSGLTHLCCNFSVPESFYNDEEERMKEFLDKKRALRDGSSYNLTNLPVRLCAVHRSAIDADHPLIIC